jgi:hypothetical protein
LVRAHQELDLRRQDVSIRELAEMICDAVELRGQLRFDKSKPDGTPQKLLDITRLRELGWAANVPLKRGIEDVYKWFRKSLDAAFSSLRKNVGRRVRDRDQRTGAASSHLRVTSPVAGSMATTLPAGTSTPASLTTRSSIERIAWVS